jgi:hypothetical protein
MFPFTSTSKVRTGDGRGYIAHAYAVDPFRDHYYCPKCEKSMLYLPHGEPNACVRCNTGWQRYGNLIEPYNRSIRPILQDYSLLLESYVILRKIIEAHTTEKEISLAKNIIKNMERIHPVRFHGNCPMCQLLGREDLKGAVSLVENDVGGLSLSGDLSGGLSLK